MDISIEKEVSNRKKKLRLISLGSAIIVLLAAVLLTRSFLTPSIRLAEITTAVAQTGDIENTINASGEVLPEFEEVLSSPINASVRSVSLEAGKQVKAGQSILTLDKSSAQTELDKLGFLIESKENEIRKLKLDLEKSFYDIKSNNKIKQLRISNLIDAVANARRLYKAGGGTREGIEQAELNLKVAELEKLQLENEIFSKQQTMKIEIREFEIALAIQRNDQLALKRKLDLANVQAARPGVVTWLNRNIGATVREGDPIARIADLSSFKVSGTISDNMLDQVSNHMPAMIRLNDMVLRGHIINISPAVNNGLISFEVQLDDRSNKALRPNMKVELFLVTAARTRVTRVANGAAFKGASSQDVFVLKNGKAQRRAVITGLSNFDYIEIRSGILPGEVVITTDMSGYKNTDQLSIIN